MTDLCWNIHLCAEVKELFRHVGSAICGIMQSCESLLKAAQHTTAHTHTAFSMHTKCFRKICRHVQAATAITEAETIKHPYTAVRYQHKISTRVCNHDMQETAMQLPLHILPDGHGDLDASLVAKYVTQRQLGTRILGVRVTQMQFTGFLDVTCPLG